MPWAHWLFFARRRGGIAKYLSNEREKLLLNLGAKEIYSIVDADNLTSLQMHQELGYREVLRAEEFLGIHFGPGEEILFRKVFLDIGSK